MTRTREENAVDLMLEDIAERLAPVREDDELEIDRTLVLSTGHVSGETAQILNGETPTSCGRRTGDGERLKQQIDGHISDWGIYGWVVWCGGQTVPTVETENELLLMPEDLHRVLMFARDHDCQYVRFDCDADFVAGLPRFEW